MDGDGKDDLIVIYPNGATAIAFVALSNGTKFLLAGATLLAGTTDAQSYLAGDVSGDGRSDLVTLWKDIGLPAGGDCRAQVSTANCGEPLDFIPPLALVAVAH